MPRRRKARSISRELDSSSRGSRCGSISTMVTSAPNERQTLANSTPITPPPRMTTEAGTRSSFRAWSLVMTRSPSMSRPGRLRDSEPVASTTCAPSTTRSPTWTWVGEMSLPSPSMTSMWRLATSPVRPFHRRGATLFFLAITPAQGDAPQGRPDAEPGALPGQVGDLAGVQQRLGRDAALVQAGPADLVLLDERDTLPQLGGAQRAGIAAAAPAENDDVVSAAVRHVLLLVRSPHAPATPKARFQPRHGPAAGRRRGLERPGGGIQCDLHEHPDRGARPALGDVAVGLALMERRAGNVDVGPTYSVRRKFPEE